MAELTPPDAATLTALLRARGKELRKDDVPGTSRENWIRRRAALREAMRNAMGRGPEKPCALEPKVINTLRRDGYRIENLIFQSRPDVWVTANAYVPDPVKGKLPAVLCVHGHFSLARRDPVIQARCLGLVKLGFFVLAVDAFGAGERYTKPAPGSYHGALYGSTLWPAGHTLLGMQVYDNQRAVDYLLTRPEVDGERLGITGASGGGNQSMNAGALDDRLKAVVPVCSVGNYQAYLHAACCVCEVLPGALTFTEEGDVLGLVAPRALLVINATKDGIQFSVDEAKKSVARAEKRFTLYKAEEKIRHDTFEAGHGYHQPMREAMYGWMTRWLKDEGKGEPIPEPKHTVEKVEDLACFPDGQRPKGFLFPPSFARREADRLLERTRRAKPDHAEDWESTAVALRTRLKQDVLGEIPSTGKPLAKLGRPAADGMVQTNSVLLRTEGDLAMPVDLRWSPVFGKQPSAVVLDLEGKEHAAKDPAVGSLVEAGWIVVMPELRGTGKSQPGKASIGGSPDHTLAEHALWVGRPLLAQWVADVLAVLDWLDEQPGHDKRHRTMIGLGQAGLVALCAAGLFEDRITSAALIDAPTSYVTEEAYPAGTRMGLLAPGLFRAGDVPHLAALVAPRPLQVVGGRAVNGDKLNADGLKSAYAFTTTVYDVLKADRAFSRPEQLQPKRL